MTFEVGTTLGDYEFIEVLHRSNAGITYKVKNITAQRFEALRVLPPNLQNGDQKAERFLREVKIHAAIAHPNIVSFYHATRLNGNLVMTTELIDGVPLDERLKTGPLTLAQALECVRQVLAALECAHERGIVHRDVTTGNILLMPDGTAKLTGFALARASDDTRLTQVGAVLGSLHYISPEQIQGVEDLDGRTDLYSVGVILYELVTGMKPFDSPSQFELMAAQVNDAPAAPIEVNREISFELDHAILKALAKQPSGRFQSAAEFRAQVESIQRVLNRGGEYKPVAPRPLPAVAAPPAETAEAAPTGMDAPVTETNQAAPDAAGVRRIIAFAILLGLALLLFDWVRASK
jgi:serine/threonine protein kinase